MDAAGDPRKQAREHECGQTVRPDSGGVHACTETMTATIKVTPPSSKKFTLALRRPFWAGNGFSVGASYRVKYRLPKR